MFGQSVCASPRTDAEYIAEHMFADSDMEHTKQMLLDMYVKHLTELLAEHSVRVVDSDRLIEILPERELELWLNLWREDYVAALLERQTPDQLSHAVHVLTAERDRSALSSTDLETLIGAATSEEFIDEATTVLTLGVLIFGTGGGVAKKMQQRMPPLTESPFLADMLATDGVFSFPNRIWRRDLIASIRNGS